MKREQSLYLKNSSVALLMVVPLVLVGIQLSADQRNALAQMAANEQPPIIELHETARYRFRSGSAQVDTTFEALLRDSVAPAIVTLLDKYHCDIVEVVGHTDGRVVSMRSSTDRALVALAHGDSVVVSPGSNADLGLMRAWMVARVLQSQLGVMKRYPKVLGYSAGQLIDTGYRLAAKDDYSDRADRRRIEIRIRRSSTVINPR